MNIHLDDFLNKPWHRLQVLLAEILMDGRLQVDVIRLRQLNGREQIGDDALKKGDVM